MVKRAVMDYMMSFRWRNFVKLWKNSVLYIWVLIINIINMSNSLLEESAEKTIHYHMWLLVFLFGITGMSLCPLRLPKIMFLSPMNEAERIRYIKTSFWVRILFPTLLGIVVEMGFVAFAGINDTLSLLYIISLFLVLLFCSAEITSPNCNSKSRHNRKDALLSIMGILLTVVIFFMLLLWDNKLRQEWNICHYILISALFLVGIIAFDYIKNVSKRLAPYAVYEEKML